MEPRFTEPIALDLISEWVVRSRAAQGLPDHIDDASVIARVASMLDDGADTDPLVS